MNSKLKLPMPKFLQTLQSWWLSSQAKFFQIISPLQAWREGSRLLSAKFLGGLLVVMLVTLPFLENAQTGVICAAVAIAWLLLWLSDRRNEQEQTVPIWTAIHTPLISYWAIAFVATLVSPVRAAAVDGMVKLTLYMLAFVSMSRLMRLGWRSIFIGAYLGSALIASAYGVQQWYLGAPELATWTDPTSETAGVTRVYSFLGNPNLFAGYLMPALPLGAIAAIHWRGWGLKALGIITAIFGTFCITQTQSRGGLMGLAAESFTLVLLLVYWWGKRLPKWTFPTVFGGMAGAIALGTMIRAKPILGIGPGNKAFNQIYPLYQRSGYSALGTYSVPLEITVETGIVGVVCYGWLVFTVFRQGFLGLNRLRSDRESSGLWIIGAIATLVGMLVHGLVDTVWYRPQVQLLWWLAIAIISSFYINPVAKQEVEIEN